MADVNITELRANLPGYVDRVQRGERIRILRRGSVVAVMERHRGERDRAREQIERLRDAARVGDVEGPIDVEWSADARP